ncbi:MAG: class I SAM-dependent methyltransferase [Verrucomicrobiales bacterium]|nr:class I SAM-dependent methyltransferase [Verrucomicrobiales bacterium]
MNPLEGQSASGVVPADCAIGTEARPRCCLCGAEGRPLYAGLRDRLFSAPGVWSLRQCPDGRCGLLWLDPMPRAEEIARAYARYYTHAAVGNGSASALKRAWRTWKAAYLTERFGYNGEAKRGPTRALAALMYLLPVRRRDVEASVRYLPAQPGGRLLDVGCGSGDWLVQMRARGWQVEGLDFDPTAVEVARKRGLPVRLGPLEQQGYEAESFDAVTLHHVIEHVPDPVATLRECHRVLRRGGRLVVATPNVHSLSHRVFGPDWRGLEPPRHLHLFTPESLRRALRDAGFHQLVMHPQIVFSVVFESLLLRRGQTNPFPPTRPFRSARALATLFNLAELVLLRARPEWADCVTVVAEKTREARDRSGR